MKDRWVADLDKLELSERQADNTYKVVYRMAPIEDVPPGSTPEYEKAQSIVAGCLSADGDLYLDHLGSHRARKLIGAIAVALAEKETKT